MSFPQLNARQARTAAGKKSRRKEAGSGARCRDGPAGGGGTFMLSAPAPGGARGNGEAGGQPSSPQSRSVLWNLRPLLVTARQLHTGSVTHPPGGPAFSFPFRRACAPARPPNLKCTRTHSPHFNGCTSTLKDPTHFFLCLAHVWKLLHTPLPHLFPAPELVREDLYGPAL